MRSDTRRPAITLLEVLAAIFIMGVGMLAILVLFPLGALNMARALRDDRAGHIAHNAGSLAIAKDLHTDPAVVAAMTTAQAPYLPPDPSGPSYPAFVDPYFALGGLNLVCNYTTAPQSPVRRLGAPYALTEQLRQRYFTLNDDLTFHPDGRPKDSGNLERQGYYSWTYMFRRNVTSVARTTEMHVIVYSGRTNLVPQQEPYFDVDLTVPPQTGNTSIILNRTNGGLPALRRGYWLFDISYNNVPAIPPAVPQFGRVNGHFYRVIEATQINTDQVQVEIEPPLKSDAVYQIRRVVSLENAIEVFDRGTGR